MWCKPRKICLAVFVLLILLVTGSVPAMGKCVPRTIRIQGHVGGNDLSQLEVVVQIDPKPKWSSSRMGLPLERDGKFEAVVRFNTYSYSLLYEVCTRRPKKVTVALCSGAVLIDYAALRIRRDFKLVNRRHYQINEDIVFDATKSNEAKDGPASDRYALLCISP